MKKLALISVVVAGVAFTAVGCASQAGVEASGAVETSSVSPAAQANVGVQAGTSIDAQPGNASADISGAVSGSAGADASAQ